MVSVFWMFNWSKISIWYACDTMYWHGTHIQFLLELINELLTWPFSYHWLSSDSYHKAQGDRTTPGLDSPWAGPKGNDFLDLTLPFSLLATYAQYSWTKQEIIHICDQHQSSCISISPRDFLSLISGASGMGWVSPTLPTPENQPKKVTSHQKYKF